MSVARNSPLLIKGLEGVVQQNQGFTANLTFLERRARLDSQFGKFGQPAKTGLSGTLKTLIS